MRWIFSEFRGNKPGIKPHICHPFYHRTRMAYLFETYGALPTHTKKIVDLQIDFGGMICTNDPSVEVELAGERILSCWQHQASDVVRILEMRAKEVKHGRYTFYKFGRWPGVLCFISKTDRDTVIKTLRRTIDLEGEMEHNAQMREHLVRANAGGDKAKEKKIRELFDAQMGGQSPNN